VRRHPLAGYVARLLVGGLLTPLVAGCITIAPAVTASPPASIEVTVTTATGETTAFDPAETVVDAARPIAITFRNASSLPHNLVFTAGVTAATRTIVAAGTSDELLVSPLGPGTYPFVCTIHDGMVGALIVRSAGSIADPAAVP
jgi:plastocyanin